MKIKLNTTHCGLTSLFLLAILLLIGGCATGSRHDPLEGWKDVGSADIVKGCPFGQTIEDDFQNYIRNLPAEEKRSVTDNRIHFYEGVNGQRAVEITTYAEGAIGQILWKRILIYDLNNRRIKTIRYKSGRFLS